MPFICFNKEIKRFIYKLLYINYRGYIMNTTTIQIDKSLLNSLKEVKEYPRQTYNELIKNMVNVFHDLKKKNQYDEFLHKIQQVKMKELWDNKEDEAWKNA